MTPTQYGVAVPARAATASRPSPAVLGIAGIANARERLAINLRAYAHSRGAPIKDDDEEVALAAARKILATLGAKK